MKNKMTAVEKIIEEINNELQTLEGFDGKEITGSRIALEFVKKVAIEAKEMEKEQIEDAFDKGWERANETKYKPYLTADDYGYQYYNETFKSE